MSALVAGIFAAALVAPGDGRDFVLDNGVTRATFVVEDGGAPELATIEDVGGARPAVRFATATGRACGGFDLVFRRRGGPFGKTRHVTSDDRAFTVAATSAAPGPDGASSLLVRWSAERIAFDGADAAATVTVEWRLRPGRRELDARLAVNVPGLSRLPVYLSQAVFPRLELRRIGAAAGSAEGPAGGGSGGAPGLANQLVLPHQCGVLMREPLDLATSPFFPQKLAGPPDDRPWMVANLALPLLAYYDEATRDGVWITDDDVVGTFRDYEVERWSGAGGPVLELRCRHLPPDLFRAESFAPPYAMRVAPLRGDWVDVAESYRSFLADPANGATFYEGPVGGAANSMARALKATAFHANLGATNYGDNLDLLARDGTDLFRKAGLGGLQVWHGGFDEEFDDFYAHETFGTPPSFGAAVRAAERRFGTIVAPYVNGSRAVDAAEAGITEPGPMMRATAASAVRLETGKPFLLDTGRLKDVVQCNGAPPWQGVFVERALDVLGASHAHAIYFDAFGTTPCFADSADPSQEHAHAHAPGGGSYMHAGRRAQLREVRARAAASGLPLDGIVIEGATLWYLGAVDVMHSSPLSTELLDLGRTRSVASARTIPLFRMVADSVKLSDFYEHEPGAPAGRRAWLMAMDVFAFGLLPHSRNAIVDVMPSHGSGWSCDDEPYERYLRRLVRCLRDDGFLRFHDGTLLRSPDLAVEGGEALAASLGPDAGTPPSPGRLAPWVATPLVAAMYRAPAPSREVSFVVTNPWVAGGPALTLRTRVDLARCGLSKAGRTVTVRDDAGKETTSALSDDAPFEIGQRLAPGEIWRWVFSDAGESDGATR